MPTLHVLSGSAVSQLRCHSDHKEADAQANQHGDQGL